MAEKSRSSEEQQELRKVETVSLPARPPLPEDFQGGKYANHIVVGFSQWEFVLDFWRVDPGAGPEGARMAFVDRIIISPHNVKGLIDALSGIAENFEQEWGISLPNLRGATPRSDEG